MPFNKTLTHIESAKLTICMKSSFLRWNYDAVIFEYQANLMFKNRL